MSDFGHFMYTKIDYYNIGASTFSLKTAENDEKGV